MGRRLRVQIGTLLLGAALCVIPMQAMAQQQVRIPVSELLSRLDRLESDVAALNSGQSKIGEDQIIRLDQIELELRRMTGILERLEYDQRQAQQRAEKRAQDFESRLQELESASQQAIVSAPAPPVVPDPAAVYVRDPASVSAVELSSSETESGAPRRDLPPPQYTDGTSPAPTFKSPPRLLKPSVASVQNFDTAPDMSAVPGAPVLQQQPETMLASVAPPSPPVFEIATIQNAASVVIESASLLYTNAIEMLNQGRFDEAGQIFEQIVADHPADPETGQAKYWLGDMHLRLGQFEFAAQSFLESFRGWPDGPKAPESLLKLGITLANLGQQEEACLTFTQFAPRYPNAPERLIRRAALESRRAQCGG